MYMSRVGKQTIKIPSGVTVEVTSGLVRVKGAKTTLEQILHPAVTLRVEGDEVHVAVKHEEDKRERALWGTFASLLINMIEGVTKGYQKKLEINGVGYRAEVKGKDLVLNVGYSHPVVFPVPSNITITTEKNVVTVSGADKQRVGEIAAQIRSIRKPEPYKGKGIKYVDELIRRKAGKAGKAAA